MSTRVDGVAANRWLESPTPVKGDGDRVEDTRTLGSLIRELSDDSTRLLRQEIELAKAEMSEKLDVYKANLTKLVIGGALLVAALFGVLITINHALTSLLDRFLDLDIAYWLAPLILTVIIAIVGQSMLHSAKQKIARESMVPHKTIDSLKGEKQWIEGKVK